MGLLFFLFPVFLYTDTYLDVGENKAWFAVSLFRRLRLFGGYAELRREGIAVHLTKNFAALIRYDKMGDTRKKFDFTQGFQLWRFHQIIETGGADSVYAVLLAAAIKSAVGGTFSYIRTKYPFVSLKNSTLLAEGARLKVTFETAVIFNGLVLTVAFTKKLLEALINRIRRKKLTASWKRQRSN